MYFRDWVSKLLELSCPWKIIGILLFKEILAFYWSPLLGIWESTAGLSSGPHYSSTQRTHIFFLSQNQLYYILLSNLTLAIARGCLHLEFLVEIVYSLLISAIRVVFPPTLFSYIVLESSWNVMAHGDAREWKWRGNSRMEWVASTLHTTSEHVVFSITTADAHTSTASSRLNWRPPPI